MPVRFFLDRERAVVWSALVGVLAFLGGCAVHGRAVATRRADEPAQESLRIADADFDREPRSVDAAGALADLDAAQRIFEEAYAGLDGQPRLPDAALIAEARRRLASQIRWSPDAFAAELHALFGRPDGHLAFGYSGRSPLRLTAFPTPPGMDGKNPPALGAMAVAVPVPGSGSSTARPQLTPMTATDESAAAVHFTPPSGDRVPVVAIRTFDAAAEGTLSLLPTIARRLRTTKAFVVDLRGNHGGNYAFAEAFILALTDRTLKRLDEREVRSVAAAEGRANSARRRIAAGEVPKDAARSFVAHIAALSAEARALRAAGAGRAEIVTRGATVRGHAPGPLEGRAVFLVDRGCASACEMMLALARQIPGVILAGENTQGSMAVGEVALFRLPSSGVTISLGTRAFHDPLGDFAETRGFLPDVWLSAEDPMAEARHLASTGRLPNPRSGRLLLTRAGFRR
jgi:hypothetical protein